jgi:hypothetical protein
MMDFNIEIKQCQRVWLATALDLTGQGSTVKEALDSWVSLVVDRAILELNVPTERTHWKSRLPEIAIHPDYPGLLP